MEEYLFKFEDEEKLIVAGADEAGRGPLAGPVVAAAVILPEDFPLSVLGDSKALTEKEREIAEAIIKEKAIAYAITSVSHKEIDKVNILNASLEAMAKCYEKLKENNHIDLFLVDGNKIPPVDCKTEAIVKGDGKVPEIMAASILAKVERDRIMELCDKKWPEYGYKKHKGYPTKAHYEAILKYGISPISRLSFKQYKDKQQEKENLLF